MNISAHSAERTVNFVQSQGVKLFPQTPDLPNFAPLICSSSAT